MVTSKQVCRVHAELCAIIFLILPAMAFAEGDWYIGASVGQAFLEIPIEGGANTFGFDESDTAWKVFGGYTWDFSLFHFGLEAGYVDLASPIAKFPGFQAEINPTGLNLWGVAGLDIGPFGIFGKLGALAWDIDGQTSGSVNEAFDESGSDLGYGLGVRFALWSLSLRAEYETYDIRDTESVDMLSLGLAWTF